MRVSTHHHHDIRSDAWGSRNNWDRLRIGASYFVTDLPAGRQARTKAEETKKYI